MSIALGAAARRRCAIVVSIALAVPLVGATTLGAPAALADDPLPYLDDSGRYSFEERAADLVSRMTRAEKLPQFKAERQYQNALLNNNNGIAPAIDRLGVQAYNWWNEALHGIARAHGNATNPAQQLMNGGEATEFPTGLGIAATWNRDLVRIGMAAASDEARAMNNHTDTVAPAAKHKGLTYWSPTINLNRDPRWGRAEESYGEDPYLTGEIGGQFTIGMQGTNPTYLKTAVTPKHYLANNSETNRHIGSSNLTEAELREYYTASFATIMGKYGAKSMMTAYNRANGVPMSASRDFIETLTRRTWGFDGVVTSDCGAIADVYRNNNFRWTPRESDHAVTQPEGVSYSLKAGTELDCMDNAYPNTGAGLEPAYASGFVTEEDIDVALTRAFKVRMEFGEFDSDAKVPWKNGDYTLAKEISAPDHLAAARQMSNEAVVMLKNERPFGSAAPVLPLSAATAQDIVVVGPIATYEVHGDYSPSTLKEHFTPLQGLQAAAAETGASLTYISGLNGVPNTHWQMRKPNLGRNVNGNVVARYFDASDTEVGRVSSAELQASGDYDGWQGTSGNASTFSTRGAWGASFGVPIQTTGGREASEITRVEFTFANTTAAQLLPNSRFDVHLGSRQGPIVAQIPLGTTITNNNYRTLGFDVAAALPDGLTSDMRLYPVWRTDFYQPTFTPTEEALIADADVVIAVTGTIAMYNGENINTLYPPVSGNPSDSAEEEDRSNLDLPRGQDLLIKHVAALNPRTVAWIQAVGQIDVEPFKDDVAALFWSTYNGMYQGHALGDILWGKANPSAKLPMTFYKNIYDLPNAKDYTLTPTDGKPGRTYQYFTGDITYPFGFGLSYSSFEYSNLRLSKTSADVDDQIVATVDVRNTSNRDGKEVVQLYVTSPNAADPMRPDQQLKGFTKVDIRAGSLKQVSIPLDASDLWFWDDDADKRTYDLGTWKLRLGPSADETEGVWSNFELTGELDPELDVVAAVPDGVVLNTQAQGNTIHANLSATRTDQSFYDLASPAVRVAYVSANPAVAAVDAAGTVRPVGEGVTHITATVTADGKSKSTTFPIVVRAGAHTTTNPDASETTLYARQATLSDSSVTLAAAQAGTQLSAGVVPADTSAQYSYSLSLGENEGNSSDQPWTSEAWITRPAGPGASITPDGMLTVERPGKVRVTVVATVGGAKYAKSATITVQPPLNTADLISRIAEVRTAIVGLDEDDYTASTWQALNQALTAADAVVSAPANQNAIDQALARINTALPGLTPKGDVTSLDGLLAIYAGLEAISENYTPASWAPFQQAANVARGYKISPANVSQANIDDVIERITNALNGLERVANKAILQSLTNSITDQVASGSLNPAGFTAASWSALISQLASANATLSASGATQQDVDDAVADLQAALASLSVVPSTAALQAAVAAAEAIGVASGAYTPESATRVLGAISDAWSVIASGEAATAARIAAAEAALSAAIAALVPAADSGPARIAVAGVLASAAHLDQDDFTSASWAAVSAAVAAAQAILNDPTSSSADLESAAQGVTSALSGLVPLVQTGGLAALVQTALTLDLAGATYSPASAAAVQAAIAAAQDLLAPGAEPPASQVAAATAALQAAIASLVAATPPPVPEPPVDPAPARLAVTAVLASAAHLAQGDYTAASWAALASATATAGALLESSGSSVAQLESAARAVTAALGNLVAIPPDTSDQLSQAVTALGAVAANAAGLKASDYTAPTWAALSAALTVGRAVLADSSASAQEVRDAAAAIAAALLGLAPAAAPPAPPAPPATPTPTPSATDPMPLPRPAAEVVAVKVSQKSLTLVRGKRFTLVASGYTADGSPVNATWKSSNSKIASVSAAGRITARKAGTATITVTASGKTTSVKVRVLAKAPAKAKVTAVKAKVPASMAIGQSASISASYTPARAVQAKITYRSSAPGVASVDKAGRLTAKAAGTTRITVTAGGKSKAYRVTVS